MVLNTEYQKPSNVHTFFVLPSNYVSPFSLTIIRFIHHLFMHRAHCVLSTKTRSSHGSSKMAFCNLIFHLINFHLNCFPFMTTDTCAMPLFMRINQWCLELITLPYAIRFWNSFFFGLWQWNFIISITNGIYLRISLKLNWKTGFSFWNANIRTTLIQWMRSHLKWNHKNMVKSTLNKKREWTELKRIDHDTWVF